MGFNNSNNLPDGFVLDSQASQLPGGFVLDDMPQDKQWGLFGSVNKKDYEEGSRNIFGNVFERPGAAVRAAIQAPWGEKTKAYITGSNNPGNVPTFQDLALDAYYKNDKNSALKTAGGFGVSAAGMAADILTSPADALLSLVGKAPVGQKIPKYLANQVGRSRYNLGDVSKQVSRDVITNTKETAGRVISSVQKSPEKLAEEATSIYREILNPTAGEIKNIEIRKGANVDDYFKVAAEEGLPIKQKVDGDVSKLDTIEAVEALKPKIQQNQEFLNEALRSAPNKSFDLFDIAKRAKQSLRQTTSNAKELADAENQVNKYINAEIKRHGQFVNAETLNNIKQGMWSVGYDQLRPTAKATARKIGSVARQTIEDAFPAENIRALNAKSGDYLTLQSLLENAHGRVVQGGKLGKYVGGVVGSAAGANIPLVGPIAGYMAGKKAMQILNDPKRLSKIASLKMSEAVKKTKIPLRAEVVYPDIKGTNQKLLPGREKVLGITNDARIAIPSPEKAPYRPTGKPTGYKDRAPVKDLKLSDVIVPESKSYIDPQLREAIKKLIAEYQDRVNRGEVMN